MRDRKKRTIIIGSLCCLLVFMGIGYAVLSQVLNINGTASLAGEWKIRISDISVEEIIGNATNIDDKLTFADTEATFGVNLLKPGDKIKYKVTVVNEGNVDAVLSINSTTPSNKDIKFTNSLVSGEILYGSSSANGTTKLSEKVFYVTAEFSEYATTVTTGEEAEYKIELTYTQYDGNNFYEPPKNIETDNGVFQVSADGTILNYNANLGTDVSIPAEIDGIPITTIASDAFKETVTEYIYDFKVIIKDGTTPQYVVVFKEEVWDEVLSMGVEAGFPEEKIYMVGDSTIPELQDGEIEGYYYVENGMSVAPIITDTETKTYKRLVINSLDLSNATNLEKIEAFAFSNANSNMTEDDFDSIETGLTSLTFGNNDKEIKMDIGVFAGAELDILKTYTTLHTEIDLENLSILNENFPEELYSPFAFSTINKLILQPADSIKNIMDGIIVGVGYRGTYSAISQIEELHIEEGITSVSKGLFVESIVNKIKLPNTLKTIEANAFAAVITNDFVIPKSVTSINLYDNIQTTGAFRKMVVNGTLTINATATLGTISFEQITADVVNIGSSVTSIENDAFKNATIGQVNIDSSNTTVESEAFPSGTVINYG